MSGRHPTRLVRRVLLGPLDLHVAWPPRIAWIGIALLLTALTQIGGLLLWAAFAVVPAGPTPRRVFTGLAIFALFYVVATAFVVPRLAPVFGRVQLPCRSDSEHPYRAVSILYC